MSPFNSPLVVVVDTVWSGDFREVHIVTMMAEGEDIIECLVHGADFSFANGAACSFLTDGFPGNGTSTLHDEKSAHKSVLEDFNLSTFVNHISNLNAPFFVVEALDRLVRRERSSVGVRFTVVGGG